MSAAPYGYSRSLLEIVFEKFRVRVQVSCKQNLNFRLVAWHVFASNVATWARGLMKPSQYYHLQQPQHRNPFPTWSTWSLASMSMTRKRLWNWGSVRAPTIKSCKLSSPVPFLSLAVLNSKIKKHIGTLMFYLILIYFNLIVFFLLTKMDGTNAMTSSRLPSTL